MTLETKDPDEKIVITFPYSKELNGATILLAAITIALLVGVDPNVQQVKNGDPQIAGGVVLQSAINGLSGCSYFFKSEATLSDGRILVRTYTLVVTTAT